MSKRTRGPAFRFAAVLVAALSFGSRARDARGDYDETEERLKLAGVADDVRARIHKAIDDGVKFLLARQSKDGAFHEPSGVNGPGYMEGQTALASLALAHAGGAAARAGAELGLAYLVPKGEPRSAVVGFTYDAGITAMLLAALHGDAAAARRIGRSVSAGCNASSDWWGYVLGDEPVCDSDVGVKSDPANLSTTQFGALALWASGRTAGVEFPLTWRRHLVSLCATQTENGSWSYFPDTRRRGYLNGTCMGFANLTLAIAALADDLPDDPVLAARAEIARRRAREALDRDGPAILGVGAANAPIDYYGFYALEKACVFADVEKVGGRPWYLVGAGRLIAAQAKDGSWNEPPSARVVGLPRGGSSWSVLDTSFALLFLLRASETFRPGTPRDVDSGPVTPSGAAPRPGSEPPLAEAPPESAGPMTTAAANAALDRLDALTRDRHALASDLLRALTDVDRARRGLGDAADDAWRDREERLLLKTFDEALKPTSPRRNADVAIRAANVLGGTRPAVASPIRIALGDVLHEDDVRPPSRAVLGAAFGALARLGGEASFEWMSHRVTDSTRAADVRAARAALGALSAFDGAGATDHLQAVSRIVHLLEPIEAAAANPEETEFRGLVAGNLLGSLGAAGLAALEHLCADARTGDPATAANGAPLLTFAAYARWLTTHRDAAAAPWK